MLVDSHAHLDDERFAQDRDEVIMRAVESGVAFLICPGTDLRTSRLADELARRYSFIYAAAGVHPHEAAEATDADFDEIRRLAASDRVVAIGEIGLDYWRDLSPREIQRKAFVRQLQLALELELPVIVHVREAHGDAEAILKEHLSGGKLRGVLHCYSGPLEWAETALKLGFYIGFAGPLTYANASDLRRVAEAVPIERIMVETDCPCLVPEPHRRGERNEPAFVRLVAEKVAEIKKLSYGDVCRTTGLACADLFDIPSADESQKVAYPIRNSLYLNITNRCSNRCTFCVRQKSAYVKGHQLWLEHEPTFEEVTNAIGDPRKYDEVVFCGYGEPTERLDLVVRIARWLKDQGVKVRLDTNGEGDLLNRRPIATELAGLIDSVCVSLNTSDPKQYRSLCRSEFGDEAWPAILRFIESCKLHVPEVEVTAVSAPGVDMKAVEELAKKMGVLFRARRYNEVG